VASQASDRLRWAVEALGVAPDDRKEAAGYRAELSGVLEEAGFGIDKTTVEELGSGVSVAMVARVRS
jgi:hypothetical protein